MAYFFFVCYGGKQGYNQLYKINTVDGDYKKQDEIIKNDYYAEKDKSYHETLFPVRFRYAAMPHDIRVIMKRCFLFDLIVRRANKVGDSRTV